MIKYLGSKRTLLSWIVDAIAHFSPRSVLDVFSGTSRVGHALKGSGFQVFANDHNAYSCTLARCYVESDLEDVERDATQLIAELNSLPGEPGYFTQTFCYDSRFFQPHNGARVDAIREAIERKSLEPQLKSVLLVSLMEAADRVDSTVGVQMAYLKRWAPRASNPLELRLPCVRSRARHGRGRAFQMEAIDFASAISADVAYLDPPYNQHKYIGNYHIWETLVLWDKPESYGVARKRVDCKTRTSQFNSKPNCEAALRELVDRLDCRGLVVSFSDEGYIGRATIEDILSQRGAVQVVERDHARYVGAQIGIHNPAGEKVGLVSHLRNKEYLFLVGDIGAGRTVRRSKRVASSEMVVAR